MYLLQFMPCVVRGKSSFSWWEETGHHVLNGQSSRSVCDVVSSLPGLHWLLVMVSAIAPPSPVSSARLLGIIVYFELSNSSL